MFFLFLCLLSGNYGDSITLEALKEFHRRRVKVLAESGPDLIAFETIPNKLEAKVFDPNAMKLTCISFFGLIVAISVTSSFN